MRVRSSSRWFYHPTGKKQHCFVQINFKVIFTVIAKKMCEKLLKIYAKVLHSLRFTIFSAENCTFLTY